MFKSNLPTYFYKEPGTYTYSWTSNPPGFTSNIKNPFASPIITTTYIATVYDGNSSITDSITVTVHDKPTANAGPNASYPNTVLMFQVTGTATNYSSVKWLTAGDGHFSDDTILSTEYYPGISDRSNGGVLLSLQAYPVAPCSDTATDTVFIRLTSTEGTISGATIPFEVDIAPNPSTGAFTLTIHGASDMDLKVTITDIEGKAIFLDSDLPRTQDYSRIDITTFPKGIYIVKVQTALQSITKKLVIQ